ncbi:MAG: membrane dipeptidase [Candidatus Aminicenantes bacterium]|nr:membrane dipeptidase [Candidatus Aminicenantes bacterium]
MLHPRLIAALSAACLLSLAACTAAKTPARLDEASLEAKAMAIHDRILSLDTHADTPGNMLRPNWDIGRRHVAGQPGSGQIDLPRMKEGRLDALFFAAFVGQGPLTAEAYAKARDRAFLQIEAVDKMCAAYPQLIGKAATPAEAFRLKKDGRLAAFVGLENGYPIGTDLSLVEAFARRGVRYITLCHSADNQICDSATDRRDPEDRGLSDFGREVVAACNRRGIMVDVSHISDRSFFDVLRASRAPVIATHSCCRALCDNPRNLSDEMIRALARNGGVLQVCFLSGYLRPPKPNPEREKALKDLEAKYGPRRSLAAVADEGLRAKAMAEYQAVNRNFPEERATVSDIADHIDHIVKLVGLDHVGIGTDFDGGGGVDGCSDVSEMFRVTVELLRRGYVEAQVRKIWGENTMRVLGKVIEIAEKS